MKKILSNVNIYFLLALLAFLAGLILLGFINTGDVILEVSESRHSFWNTYFIWGTKFGEEPAYFVFFILFLIMNIRYALMIPAIGALATILSFGFKSLFMHPRPKIFFSDFLAAGKIELLNEVHMIGGMTSFPSGHTISGFALFGFAAYVFSNRKNGQLWQFFFFVMALTVGLSRIYLFQHFLKDVVAGIFIGSIVALLVSWYCEVQLNQPGKWYNKSFLTHLRKSKVQRV